MSIPKQRITDLVQAHAELDEPTTAAIWIKRDDPAEAWLVEVIPAMANDDKADEDIHFNPGISFQHPLALIAGNLESLKKAVAQNKQLAQDIVDGQIVLPGGKKEAETLVATASETLKGG